MNYLLTGQETERLHFRLLQQSDFDNWIDLFKQPNIAKFLDFNPNQSAIELCKIWFDKAFYRYENNLGGMNALIDKKTNQLVGQCGLLVQDMDGIERIEVGYSMHPKFWNQGFASEAAIKCKNYAFENNLVDSLISKIHIDNIGSEKVALKNGMSFEKRTENFNVFSIQKHQWKI